MLKKIAGKVINLLGERRVLEYLIAIKGKNSTTRHFIELVDKERILNAIGNKNSVTSEITDLQKVLLSFESQGYLRDIGWINSYNHKRPLDAEMNPVPWVTYSYIHFIQDRLTKQMNILEYGSGASTLYYADRVKSVVAVEHDTPWYEEVKNKLPDNVTLIFQELIYGEQYSKKAQSLAQTFDIIIVDGRDRVNCCINAIQALTQDGVIVLDDSERKQYWPAHEFLTNNGFKKVDFWGIAPSIFFNKCTTIFYKKNNCLQL